MTRHVVIGTAGHVDHGKTALVRALTGVDTDRWDEEKRRGITIDLGFAALALTGELAASIVDVPGHEDFVRNMVAGATGIDVALLVVAADEGVMPQTAEHLAILDFVGVDVGVVAVTKADLVEAEWLELVLDDVRERVRGGAVRFTDVVAVSAVTGDGLPALRDALTAAASAAHPRNAEDLFRMPVDRGFSVAGAGTVLTGTVWSGSVALGDDVVVRPGTGGGRVRSIEVHGTSQERVLPGRRTALAVAGLGKSDAPRGVQVVRADDSWRATTAVDAELSLLPEAPALRARTRVRVHLGTAEVLARITPADAPPEPGAAAIVRLRLEQPVLARAGDRGVVRAYSPVTTIGGFRVLDPFPPARPRRPVGAAGLLDESAAARLRALLAREAHRGVPVGDLPFRLGITPDAAAVVRAGAGMVAAGGLLLPADRLDAAAHRVRSALQAFHEAEPLAEGMPLERVRRLVRPRVLAPEVERLLVDRGDASVDGAAMRLAGFKPAVPAELAAGARRLGQALTAAGFEGRTLQELTALADGMEEKRLPLLLDFLVRQGTAVRVGRERYYDAAQLEQMVARTQEVLRESGEVAPAQLRAALGLTRKYLIPFLEWLDQQGFTVRDGDVRRAGPRA